MSPIYRRRVLVHRIGISLSVLAMAFGVGALLWILAMLLYRGLGAFSIHMFTQTTPTQGRVPGADDAGGLLNPIVGSLMMVGVGTLISTPVGILAGIYLAEYGDRSWIAKVTRFVTDIMLSAPSIVIGLFVYAIYVLRVGHFSGWAGSIALSLIAIPVVVRATDNMLNLVPTSLREAAYALGAPHWKVALLVRLRAVKAGVMTGVLLAVARIAGETAPLLYTALNNQFLSFNLNPPMANLPKFINDSAVSVDDNLVSLGWGGALLITFSVLTLNIVSRTFSSQKTPS
ncbi:MAG TPA: phosphate ABC transporter permease PstA [Burkholderiaceae bacterium]